MSFSFYAHLIVHLKLNHYFQFLTAVTVQIFLGIASPYAYAAESSLTLSNAQQLAISRSRQLIAQDMAATASREMAVAAGQLPDPVIKAGIDNLPISGPDRGSLTNDFMTMRRIGIMQELIRSDKRQLRADRYDREANKIVAEKASTIAAILRDTASAWLDRYYFERMAILIAEQTNQAKLEIEAAESSYRSGRGSQADIFAARSTLSMVDDRYSEILRKVRTAKTLLNRWTGGDSELPLSGVPDIENIHLEIAALDKSLAHHPQIAVLTRETEIAEADARLAKANQQSDWSIEVAFQQRGSAYSNMVSIGISLPFQWDQKNRQDRELSSKLATVEQVKAERDEILRARVTETRAMIEEWQSDLERSARYKRELIPLAKERIQAILGSYRGGKSSLTELLAARRNEIEIQLQALQLQSDTARLWAQLNFMFPADVQATHTTPSLNKDMP
ncbi:TolC family protein [Undibacterium griseum]|uniref:TolC family protein n=1 Tax=Undibacterium griseum TaxID=2762295 RepID=A0ABR6YJL1_9BURK|nr:TolC family protein [Undibacterium griseum]MBC3884091.1 TolC family protein [Undibacterium griseum]